MECLTKKMTKKFQDVLIVIFAMEYYQKKVELLNSSKMPCISANGEYMRKLKRRIDEEFFQMADAEQKCITAFWTNDNDSLRKWLDKHLDQNPSDAEVLYQIMTKNMDNDILESMLTSRGALAPKRD